MLPILCFTHMGISHFHLFFWNHKTDLNQTWQKCSLDGHIQDFCFWRWSEIQHGCVLIFNGNRILKIVCVFCSKFVLYQILTKFLQNHYFNISKYFISCFGKYLIIFLWKSTMQRQMSFFGILPFHLFLYMFYIIVQASNALLTLQEGNTVQSPRKISPQKTKPITPNNKKVPGNF